MDSIAKLVPGSGDLRENNLLHGGDSYEARCTLRDSVEPQACAWRATDRRHRWPARRACDPSAQLTPESRCHVRPGNSRVSHILRRREADGTTRELVGHQDFSFSSEPVWNVHKRIVTHWFLSLQNLCCRSSELRIGRHCGVLPKARAAGLAPRFHRSSESES